MGAAEFFSPPISGTMALFSMGFALLGLLGGQFVIWFCALGNAAGGAGDGFCAIAEKENVASRTISTDLFMAGFRYFEAALAARFSDKPQASIKFHKPLGGVTKPGGFARLDP